MSLLRSLGKLYPLLVLTAACLGACDGVGSATGPAGTGTELSAGSYFIQYDSDDLYRYEQYFVVQPGHHWEFVEYGYTPSPKSLCQLTRHKGVYSTSDSTITLTLTAGAESVEKCGMTKADFDAYPFQAAPAGETRTIKMRNATESGFEAADMFDGMNPGWQAYAKKPDPFGFF